MSKLFEKVGKDSFRLRLENEDEYMNSPEEKREVQIGTEIRNLADSLPQDPHNPYVKHIMRIKKLAEELIKMHGKQS